jgi:hypothetical protein
MEVSECLVSLQTFVPVRTGIIEDSSVFNCRKGKVDGSRLLPKITLVLLARVANWCMEVIQVKIVLILSLGFHSAVRLLQFCSNTSKVMLL